MSGHGQRQRQQTPRGAAHELKLLCDKGSGLRRHWKSVVDDLQEGRRDLGNITIVQESQLKDIHGKLKTAGNFGGIFEQVIDRICGCKTDDAQAMVAYMETRRDELVERVAELATWADGLTARRFIPALAPGDQRQGHDLPNR